jgi:hypothetical protein
MLLINPYRFVTSGRVISSDADVNSYLNKVEDNDNQQLEQAVIDAVENFVLGCKSDGLWSAIKASCILAGARSLSGALVPLAGTAPTNFNFVSGDYDRKTGLLSNGTTKRLNSNRADNADPQDSKHFAIFNMTLISSGKSYGGTPTSPQTNINFPSPSTSARVRNNTTLTMGGNSIGFKGIARETSLLIKGRSNSTNYQNTNLASSAPSSSAFGIFSRSPGSTTECDCRIAFYSIGESLDLALLDTRVSNLMTALAAAIP